MKKPNIHIALFALYQLLIFVAPFIIKAGHNHGYAPVSSFHSFSGKAVSKELQCVVCDFEFVTFINQPFFAYFFLHQVYDVDFATSFEQVFKPFYLYFSLRAPPHFE